MQQDSLLAFDLPAVAGKKGSAAFDGGRLTSDAGVLLLREVECRLGIAERLAGCLRDGRDPARIEHTIADMLRFRMFAIAAGYEDADDCDALREDPAFKMAVGRGPESGDAFCSEPTMSRLENAPSRCSTPTTTATASCRSTSYEATSGKLVAALRTLAARVIEKATVIRVALASACPDKALFAHSALAFAPQGL